MLSLELTIHFLFNLSLLLVLLFFCILWSERLNKYESNKKITTAYFLSCLIISSIFTYEVHNGILLGLNNVGFIVGGLYAGLSPFLALVIIIIRGFYGFNIDFWITVLFYGGMALCFRWLSPWFVLKRKRYRVFITIALTSFLSILHIVPLELLYITYERIDIWFACFVIIPLGAGLISSIMEELCKIYALRRHVLKARKLEAVEQMAAAISHEIRNPLTSAIGFIQLLREGSIDKEKENQYLSIIKTELKSAERVIQDYFTFSSPNTNITETIIIEKVLQEVLESYHLMSSLQSIQIKTNFLNTLKVVGDEQRLHQCLVNIIKNAIEAMNSGGILTVETESVGEKVFIRIKDTGIGMNQEQIDRLGEPYYSTKGDMGTGLGLMVSYSIVRAMGGTIHVESKVGTGTCFHLTLPGVKAHS